MSKKSKLLSILKKYSKISSDSEYKVGNYYLVFTRYDWMKKDQYIKTKQKFIGEHSQGWLEFSSIKLNKTSGNTNWFSIPLK